MADPELRIALARLTEEAGRLAQRLRRENLIVETKPDGSIVTNADREVETFFRKRLPDLIADATVWGEEFGFTPEGPGGLWLIDPIDGTTNFSRGSMLWGVSVALYQSGEVRLSAVALPDLNELYSAELGTGAYLGDLRLPYAAPGPVTPQDPVSYCESLVRRYPKQVWPGKQRCAGACVADGCFAAAGRVRGLIGIGELAYDMAGIALLGTEAGLGLRYADGRPFAWAPLINPDRKLEPWLLFPRESGFVMDTAV